MIYRLNNINKTYVSKKNKKEALNIDSLEFSNNGLVFIVGESGCGKTTLLNLLSLQDQPTSGTIEFKGSDVAQFSTTQKDNIRNKEIGLVFQELNLIETLNVYDNIALPLELGNQKVEKEQIVELIKNLGLEEEVLFKRVDELSGGQQQRVAIARCLIKNPSIILADEPTGSLDPSNSTNIIKLLKDISKDKLVIVVSHNHTLANKYADRLIKIEKGKIISDKTKNNTSDILTDDNKELCNKKCRIPFRRKLFFAKNNLKHSIMKLIFSSISLIISLTSVLIVTSVFDFNYDKEVANCLDKYSPYARMFYGYTTGEGAVYNYNEITREQKIEIYREVYGISEVLKDVDSIYSREIKSVIAKNLLVDSYIGSFNTVQQMGLNPIGSLQEGQNELLVSFDLFRNYGSILIGEPVVVNDYESCFNYIGKEIEFSHGKYKISGFYDPLNDLSKSYLLNDPDNGTGIDWNAEVKRYSVIINNKDFDDYLAYCDSRGFSSEYFYTRFLFPCTGEKYSDLMKNNAFNLHDACYDKLNKNGPFLYVETQYDSIVMSYDSKIGECEYILYGILICFTLIAFFNLLSYIDSIVDYTKQDTKIMRSLGTSFGETFGIYSIQNLLSLVWIALPSIALQIPLLKALNQATIDEFYLIINIFNFNPLIVLLLVAITYGICELFVFLSLKIVYRKKKII